MRRVNQNESVGNKCELFCKGLKLATILDGVSFSSYYVSQNDDFDISMIDFLSLDESVENYIGEDPVPLTKDNIYNELEYFVHAMTPGLRALADMGIT